jgi:hypothetical protein
VPGIIAEQLILLVTTFMAGNHPPLHGCPPAPQAFFAAFLPFIHSSDMKNFNDRG